MSHILLINYEYPPIGAGAANATFHMANALLDLGHKPVVITAAYDGNVGTQDEQGVIVCRIPSIRKHPNKSNMLEMASYMMSLAINLRRIVHSYRTNGAIIFFSFPCGPMGLVLRTFFDNRYLISLRGGDVPGTEPGLGWLYWLLTPVRRLVFHQSDAVIANSAGLANLSQQADPYPVKVIPNGVDTDFWCPGAEKIDSRSFNILFVGRFHSQKNLHFLLEEFATFLKRQPDAQLTLIGDGPDAKSLKSRAHHIGISEQVHWLAWADKPALRNHYRSATCLVNPSLYEGMPNVLLEAMACGTTVIASDTLGNNEVIEDGVTGWLYQPTDTNGLQTAFSRVQNARTEALKIAENARQKMISDYSWLRVGQQYLDCFKKLEPIEAEAAEAEGPAPERTDTSHPGNHRSIIVKLLISGSLVGFLLLFAEPGEMLESIGAVDAGAYLLAATLYLAVQLISATKWHLLIAEINFTQLLKFTFIGAYYNLILPGQVSGEIAKTWRIAKGSAIAEHIAASVFIDRMTGVIALFVLALIGASVSESDAANFVIIPGALATILLVTSIFLMRLAVIETFSKWLVTSLMSHHTFLQKQLPKVIKLLDHLVQYSREPLKLFVSILIGILLQFAIVLITFVMCHALSLPIGLIDLTWIMGIISLLIFLPISISGIGVRELGFVGALGLFGISVAQAMTVSLLTFSLQILGAVVGAGLELFAPKRK